jgi:hypothetical protein
MLENYLLCDAHHISLSRQQTLQIVEKLQQRFQGNTNDLIRSSLLAYNILLEGEHGDLANKVIEELIEGWAVRCQCRL